MPALVRGVGLAGEDDLHGTAGIGEEPREPLEIREEEVGTLVGGEAPCEADRERLRVEAPAAQPLEEPRLRTVWASQSAGGVEAGRARPARVFGRSLRLHAGLA